jgi:hypothetical protein
VKVSQHGGEEDQAPGHDKVKGGPSSDSCNPRRKNKEFKHKEEDGPGYAPMVVVEGNASCVDERVLRSH